MKKLVARLAAISSPLVALFVFMMLLAAVAFTGLLSDPRAIAGARAWLKPLRFAVSVAIYALSFAWLLGQVRGKPRFVHTAGTVTAAVLAIEVLLVFVQAGRGTSSHFNRATSFDAAIFGAMGLLIVILWLLQIATVLVLLRQPFSDLALAWTLRAAMLITAFGAGIGWLMIAPGTAQHELLQHGARGISGSHTVGGLDGGPGLPFTDWSATHGDLRVAHFLGLHALQLLPCAASIGRGAPRLAFARVVSLSYGTLVCLLLWQALRGQSVAAPDAAMLGALAVWFAGTIAGLSVALRPSRAVVRP